MTGERGLFVAGRGGSPSDGLHYFREVDGSWAGIQLATVEELAALCWHPNLPVVYGLSGLGRGLMHAWDVSAVPDGAALPLATLDCLGDIPCDLAVDPTGRMLVAANFESGTLSVWSLDPTGVPQTPGEVVQLGDGSFGDPDKQAGSHPHQVVFVDDLLYVPDFGSDLLRRFRVDPTRSGADALVELEPAPVPARTAPRHMVIVPGRESEAGPWVAMSGELASALLAGRPGGDAESWAVVAGTSRTGQASGRHPRNYPGDLKLSPDGRIAYFANRGYDTIAAFAVDRDVPELVTEVDSGTAWPQHLLVIGDELLVAGWDSSNVTSLPLADGVPGTARVLFECAGAGWLLADRAR